MASASKSVRLLVFFLQPCSTINSGCCFRLKGAKMVTEDEPNSFQDVTGMLDATEASVVELVWASRSVKMLKKSGCSSSRDQWVIFTVQLLYEWCFCSVSRLHHWLLALVISFLFLFLFVVNLSFGTSLFTSDSLSVLPLWVCADSGSVFSLLTWLWGLTGWLLSALWPLSSFSCCQQWSWTEVLASDFVTHHFLAVCVCFLAAPGFIVSLWC